MKNKFLKGSVWRKWDLHFHTPSSYDYKNKSLSNEDIIHTLEENKVSVVAITDHHVMDIERITELQRLGRKKGITVFPGIELRSELGGSESIHFIGIFPEKDINLEEVWLDIQAKCNLKPSDLAKNGDDKIFVDFKETASLFHELGAVVTIHAGSKTNSLENITNSLPYKMALKEDVVDSVDMFELGGEKDQDGYRDVVFKSIGKVFPMIICSDSHNANEYKASIKQNLWIKSDPTFEGLKQILYEPERRVRIQSECPDDKNDYEVIDKVRFIDNSFDKTSFTDDWIELNPDLNSIIGGKSSGKSLFLYQIAKTIDPEGTKKAVNSGDRSIKYSYNYDLDFEVQWRDGVVYKQSSETPERERAVTFIPQLYLNAVAEDRGEDFHEVIKDILLAKPEYASWYQDKKYSIDSLKKDIHSTTNDYLSLFHRRKNEIDNLKKMGDQQAIEKTLSEQRTQMLELKKASTLEDDELTQYVELDKKVKKAVEDKKRFSDISMLYADIEIKLSHLVGQFLGAGLDDISSELKTKYSSMDDVSDLIDNIFAGFGNELRNTSSLEIEKIKGNAPDCVLEKKKLDDVLVDLDNKIKPFIEKIKNKEVFDKLEKSIKAEELKLQAILDKKKEIEAIKYRLGKLNLSSKLSDLLKVYEDIVAENMRYRMIDSENETILLSNLDFDQVRFKENFTNRISKKMLLAKQLDQSIFDENNDLVFSLSTYVSDIEIIFKKLVAGELKLNQGSTLDDVVHGLLDDYFEIRFDLEQHGDRLMEMSPGKRGIILFQLFLHLSNASHPILIDQPEDNLDNRTVYRELNDFIKEKKIQRQIIIVSHNANLVVSTDSEEVIVANQSGQKKDGDNEKYKFEYVTGALENSFSNESEAGILNKKGIREHVCEVLEGGLEAFKKRELQYASIKNQYG